MTLRSFLTRTKREDGAVLPLVALLLLVLFGFAALGVDATAAYAERREAQSAADAAVMAGALKYLEPTTPTGSDLAATVKSYVFKNWPGDKNPSDADWATCIDSSKPAEYAPILDTSTTPAVVISDCISIKQVDGEPALLRVHLPTYDMPTSFASIIGWDSLAISATATAELQLQFTARVLPFSLPSDPATEECLSTPPSGLLDLDGFLNPCEGPNNGNFGMLDSPWFGADDPHFTTEYVTSQQECQSVQFNTIAAHNIAVGLDHLITTHPAPQPGLGENQPAGSTGADSCNAIESGVIPYILNPKTGDSNGGLGGGQARVELGLLGNDPSPTSGSLPGRLRQGPSLAVANNRYLLRTGVEIDNVGLWEYINYSGGGACDQASFNGKEGRELTVQLLACLRPAPPGTPPDFPIFSVDLLESPRFALVPILNYSNRSDLPRVGEAGSKWWAVKELKPVYLQATWYQCQNAANSVNECLFLPEDSKNDPNLDRDDLTFYSKLMIPGEGTEAPCRWLDPGCGSVQPGQFKLLGLSALVLDWDMFPPGAANQYGDFAPYQVFLHDNEYIAP